MLFRVSHRPLAPIFVALAVTSCAAAYAQKDSSYQTLELFAGSAYSFDSDLEVSQEGHDTLNFSADWSTSGTGAPYYVLRYGNWSGDNAWEIEHIHHKLELKNRPPEITNFQISHGFNMFMYNRAWRRGDYTHRAGAGVVVTHPENTVRGLALDGDRGGDFGGGYYLSGAAAQYALGYSWPIAEDWVFTLEGKATLAWVEVPVVDGDAELWNYALHYIAGFGYMWD